MNANSKMMNTYRVGDNQKPSGVNPQIMKDDVGIPQTFSPKKKKGVSDPRFKRIINAELKKKLPVMSDEQESDDILKDKVISLLKPPKDISLYAKTSTKRFGDVAENSPPNSIDLVTKDPGLQFSSIQSEKSNIRSKKHQENVHTLKNSCKIKKNIKTGLKRSASDCTLQVKNLFGNENDEDHQSVRPYPSGTQITSCANSRKGHKPDNRRSVITVIGQTQTKPFKEIFQEINQRRKLAKELDKHALCEAIMESNENSTEVKNLVAKVDFVLPDGKVIYSREKVYLCKDKYNDCGECLVKSRDTLEDEFKKRRDMIPERDSSVSQIDKKNRQKRSGKKLTAPAKEKSLLKGKAAYLSPKLVWVFLLIVFFFVCMCSYIDSIKPSQTYYCFHRFFAPQTLPWYEKLLF